VPNLPIRGLGSVGVVTDVDPYNLPINGFTRGKNIRFNEGKVSAGPVFRDASPNSQVDNPMFVYGIESSTGYDTVLVVDDQFTIQEYSNGSYTQRHTGTVQSNLTELTATNLANVVYVNRSDKIPVHRTSGANNFTDLPNWPSTLRTKAIRSFGDFLIALNTTEGGVDHRNRVRFSTTTLSNQVPSTWDETDTTESAGFNDLVQMKTPIVDGATLGSNFLIYSSDQVWMMEFVGGSFIFNFRKLFDDAGAMSQNCIVEVTGKHYVFDFDDIYVTDGNSRQSICDGRVRDYIFNGIDYSKKGQCFVLHNAALEEVYFCYHSGDDLAVFEDGDKCNRAAVYNYKEDTWTFQDLPNVVGGGIANIQSVTSYASVDPSITYANSGGTYLSQESEFKRHAVMFSKKTFPAITFVVTRAAKSAGNTSAGSSNAFYIDGVEQPTLTLQKGQTYIFDVSDSSMMGHPFRLFDGNDNLSAPYTVGVTFQGSNGNAGGAVILTMGQNDVGPVSYGCLNHLGMGNSITVQNTLSGVLRSTLYGLDLQDLGSLTQGTDTDVSKPAFLERTGIDLDEQGTPLSGYKVINTFYPQMNTPNSDGNFEFTFGAADIPTATPTYDVTVTFDSNVAYKVNTRISGRYLSYKLALPTLKDFSFSGMDVDVIVTGRR